MQRHLILTHQNDFSGGYKQYYCLLEYEIRLFDFPCAFKFSKKRNSEISKELMTAIITSYLEDKIYIYRTIHNDHMSYN